MRGTFIFIFIIIFSIFIVNSCNYALSEPEEITATISHKERVYDADRGSRYLIFTDAGTFENVDSLIYGKFDSSDLYGYLQVGETYSIKIKGIRSHFFSIYPNILEAKIIE
jgi:hypothetical protein